jgi:cation transport ATPase
MITSYADGRARFRHDVLQRSAVTAKIEGELASLVGVTHFTVNQRVGSLLVTYDHLQVTIDDILAVLRKHIPSFSRRAADDRRKGPRRERGFQLAKRRVLNIGLIVSLAGSLIALPLKAKTAHVQLGIVFTVLSLLHAIDKKRTLFA